MKINCLTLATARYGKETLKWLFISAYQTNLIFVTIKVPTLP